MTKVRLAYLVSHPIQYQTPLLRRIAQEPDIELTVLFGSDFSVRGYQDTGFGVDVKWDIPLLEGYRYKILPAFRDGGPQSFFRPLNYGILAALRGDAGERPFDVMWVHGYATANSLHALLAARSLGIPVLIRGDMWLRDRPRSRVKLGLKRLFFAMLHKLVHGVLSVGTLNDEYWLHHFGDDIPRFLMPYAVDNAYFQERTHEASSTREQLRTELGLTPGRPIILFASKLQERKHCADLLEAYRIVSSDAEGETPYLLIVGDGEQRTALERQAREIDLSDGIRFCGFRNQSELPRFFDLCDVFVLPARHEPWGLIINEVMNAGRAVIISDDIGCQPDLVKNGVEGFVYPVRDTAALADALKQTLFIPGAAERMGREALAKINRWSFEENVAALRTALTHLTRKGLVE